MARANKNKEAAFRRRHNKIRTCPCNEQDGRSKYPI